ncbi:MAG: CoA transferase [Oryzihumus sp.]
MTDLRRAMTRELWDAVHSGSVVPSAFPAVGVRVTDRPELLPSHLPVREAALATVSTALLAAASFQQERGGRAPLTVTLDAGHVAAAVRSERYVRVGGVPAVSATFAPLSRFWPTADGWLRTHANYPWHRDALVRALGAGDEPESVARAIRELPGEQAEAAIVGAGGIAAAVRSEQEWHGHPQGRAVAGRRLVERTSIPGAEPRTRTRTAGDRPADGLRVLDLTRVIAGPVCTRYLGALGANVLRLDPPHRPEPDGTWDTVLGKRSAVLDARTREGLARLHTLLDEADVLVHGYRPGALDAFGLTPADLAERHPGLAFVALSAWGPTGPWGAWRGFDSIVQAASGIAVVEGDEDRPGAMPCQLLDHGTGYLAVAAVLEALTAQSREGGTQVRELALARTARWLLGQPRPEASGQLPTDVEEVDAWLRPVESPDGRLDVIAPAGALDGRPLAWPHRVGGYAAAEPVW